MSAINYLTYGDRSVMVAKPASHQDLKREIRKHFPMLASVFNIVVLYKPKLEDGSMLNHYVEVDPSAYSAIHDGAEVFINVADPITKRYIFPLPDGSRSNVGPQNQVAHTDGLGNRVNPATGGGVPLNSDMQVSTNKSKSSKYNYPGMESSIKPERADGAACASGWADASERFHRSAKLIPNLKDCKEAVGLEVGKSNCYPDDEETADNELAHVQKETATGPVLTEKGWYTGTEDLAHIGREMPVAGSENNIVLPAGRALFPVSDRHDETNFHSVGKNDPNTTANNVRGFGANDIQPFEQPGRSEGASSPEAIRAPSECSPGRRADTWGPCAVTPPSPAHQNFDHGSRGEEDPFFSPAHSPARFCGGWVSANSARISAGRIWALNNEKNNADQQPVCTEYYPPGSYNYGNSAVTNQTINTWGAQAQMALPAALPGPAFPMNHGYAKQVSQNFQNYADDHGGSGWSPPQRSYSGLRGHQSPEAYQTVSRHYPPEFHIRPSYGSFTPDNPGRFSTGSPIAKFRRLRPSRRTVTGREIENLANIGHNQAQYQATNDQQSNIGQQFNNGQQLNAPLQSGFPPTPRVGGDIRRPLGQTAQHNKIHARYFWPAAANNDFNVGGLGGGGYAGRGLKHNNVGWRD